MVLLFVFLRLWKPCGGFFFFAWSLNVSACILLSWRRGSPPLLGSFLAPAGSSAVRVPISAFRRMRHQVFCLVLGIFSLSSCLRSSPSAFKQASSIASETVVPCSLLARPLECVGCTHGLGSPTSISLHMPCSLGSVVNFWSSSLEGYCEPPNCQTWRLTLRFCVLCPLSPRVMLK